jgi:hypothetical protein
VLSSSSSFTTSNTTETFETTDTDTDSNLSESTVNTETSFQESSNTRAETDVLPVLGVPCNISFLHFI